MATDDLYLTVQQFRDRVRLTDAPDSVIETVIAAASRQIDDWTGRYFGQDGTVGSPAIRYVGLPAPVGYDVRPFPTWQPVSAGNCVEIPDTVSLSEVALDLDGDGAWETVLDAAEWVLQPRNAAARNEPYTELRTTQAATHAFPTGEDAIRLSGIFGWPAIPAPIVEACFTIGNRQKSIWSAPFGISGQGDLGTLTMSTTLTPIIQAMLSPYRAVVV